MRHFINCRYCDSIGSERLCSACSLNDEHKDLPSLVSRPKKQKPATKKEAYISECVAYVKSLNDEIEF